MARFDVYRVDDMPGYLLDCQADVLSDFSTRFAVPLLPAEYGPPATRRLNPIFVIEGERVIMFTQLASAIGLRKLSAPVASLSEKHSTIMDALDMLITGC